ncbi:hypothetical protein ARMSODRAFT_961940 [Armillaria solidipes]|uniref:Uncharacterized protein n=1 Tax=Armillaria solidipes TaxID=1076256 RepID=A0A2H3B0H1_9AGAR|nr:hypothetical protein ARMSODRAFT_961940 [Armillaria solidipes]
MSSAVFPSRGQCTQVTDNIQRCQCPSFASPLLDPYICVNCGHGIHGHADYVSMVVNRYPPTQCAAYVQKTPLAQRCTCEAQLCDHLPTNNLYRSAEPWIVLDQYFPDNNSASYSPVAISFSNGATNDPYTPSSMSFSRDANLMPITTTPVFSPSPRTFIPSSEAGNISLAPTPISSPSASSASTGIQSDITQAQAYGPDDHFVQSLDHFMNESYDRQLDGCATDENLYHHDHSNVIYGSTSEAWSGPYA